MKHLKVTALFLLFTVLMGLFSCTAEEEFSPDYSTLTPSDNFYVTDTMNEISAETVSYIGQRNAWLEQETGAQIVIVLTSGLGGQSTSDYTTQLFNNWGIGSAERDNGVLFLMTAAEEDYWALQGKGIEDVVSSGVLGVILDDYVEVHFAQGDYDGSARAFFDQVYTLLCTHYGISTTPGSVSASPSGDASASHSGQAAAGAAAAGALGAGALMAGFAGGFFRFVGILIVIVAIIVIAILLSMPRRGRPGGGAYGGGYRSGRIFYTPTFRPRPRRPYTPPPPPRRNSGGNPFGRPGGSSSRPSGGSFGGGGRSSGFGGSGRSSGGFSGGSRSGGGGSSRGGGAGRGRR